MMPTRETVGRAVKRLFREGRMRSALEKAVRGAVRVNPSLAGLFQDHPSAFGAIIPLEVSAEIARSLDEIPSQSTQQERRFLYQFFDSQWEGKGDVVEVGPFLGGTTRAIALGMQANPRRSANSTLHTFDRFAHYWTGDELVKLIEPLISKGTLPASMRETARTTSFLEVFRALHDRSSYGSLIKAWDHPLPDVPEQVPAMKDILRVPDGAALGAVFIDGCKSWFGTKYFMMEMGRHALPGSYYLFQDYGWYTCFWLPAFIGLMGDRFKLVSYVDSTYTFQLRGTLDEATINRRVPDDAPAVGEGALTKIFEAQLRDAIARSDSRGVVSLTLQHAAALAYIGNKERAKSIIDQLATKNVPPDHREMIVAARKSPTYTAIDQTPITLD